MLRPLFALALGLIVASASLAASAADQTPYEINAVLSLTGPAAFIGASEARTLGIVATTVNHSGGINGRPIAFHISDDQSNPVLSVQLVNGLIGEHVPLIFGPGFTATCAATMALTMKTGPVMWCMAPGIYPDPGSYVFSTQATTDQTVIVMVRYFRLRGWKRMAVISSTDASGQAFDHGVATAAALPENRDVQIVAHEHMSPTDISISAQASRIKAANPQVLMTLATGSPWGTIMRGIADAGIDVPIGGGNGNLIIAQLDQYRAFLPSEMYFPGNIAVAPESIGKGPIEDAQAVYFNAFRAAGIKPDLGYNIGWDPAMILVGALRALGTSASAEQVRNYIVNLHGWVGINGVYDFRDGAQRGIGQRSQVMDRWDKTRSVFVAVSRPAGYLKAK
jgi:branched-chain amino acid transport system substrate-binding protein